MIRIVPTITAPVTPPGWTPERGTNHRFDWSPVEKQVIREQYLPAGLRACQRLLPPGVCTLHSEGAAADVSQAALCPQLLPAHADLVAPRRRRPAGR
jgi:hypothetical protein